MDDIDKGVKDAAEKLSAARKDAEAAAAKIEAAQASAQELKALAAKLREALARERDAQADYDKRVDARLRLIEEALGLRRPAPPE
jgi:hypothetical protein